jgi:hypothetical protein
MEGRMSGQSLFLNVRDFLAERRQRRSERARALAELAFLTSDDVYALAAECGLSPGQFREITARGRHAADELIELARALDIDIDRLESSNRNSLNDMKLVCAGCQRKAACRKSIAKGTIARDHVGFCNNAELLADAKDRLLSLAG